MKPFLVFILSLFCFNSYGQMSKKEAKNFLGHFDFATFQTDSGTVHNITTAKESKLGSIVLEYSSDGKQWTKVEEIKPSYKNEGYFEQNNYSVKSGNSPGMYRVSIFTEDKRLVDYRINKI